jgi:uncharacterized membrane protein YebE (DUF533 family)
VAEDANVDERIVRYPLRDGKTLRWFTRTNDGDSDARVVFREVERGRDVPGDSMRSDLLVNGVLAGVLGSRGKKARKATRYLTGGRTVPRRSSTATLLTAAGLAWGVIETLQRQGSSADTGSVVPGPPGSSAVTPPPVPPPTTVADEKGDGGMTDALRLVRLAISAAAADGTLNDAERAAIVQHATADGLGDIVEYELANPRPLADVVSGVTNRDEAATLYVLAFTIVRADEQVTGSERIYLARLAQVLGLDAATVQSLEVDIGARIEALGDQGQSGG